MLTVCGHCGRLVGLEITSKARDNAPMNEARTRYSTATIAPWAEVVPGAGPATVEDLFTLPDDGWCYEVVEGVLVRVAGSPFDATTIALILGAALLGYARPRDLGAVTGADGVYQFRGAETGLVPGIGFVVAARVASVNPKKPIPFAPDLAVEVVSSSQTANALAAKAVRYLDGGTRLVWVVWPDEQQVDVWHPGDRQPSITLGINDLLDGEDVVPGFSHPVADLFV
jgi:Uma2 family endonuclease